jgi:hypothetical protein
VTPRALVVRRFAAVGRAFHNRFDEVVARLEANDVGAADEFLWLHEVGAPALVRLGDALSALLDADA